MLDKTKVEMDVGRRAAAKHAERLARLRPEENPLSPAPEPEVAIENPKLKKK